jgi:hypothetical protein
MPTPLDTHTLSHLISENAPVLDWGSFSPPDWDLLLQLARQEGVAPLLYWRLSKSGRFSSIPESARNALRALYAATWTQNQKILKELGVLAHLFHEAGIPLVVLKGACYALTLYPDIGLRPMGDLDVLVPKEMMAEAVRIAESLGYVDSKPEASPGLRSLLNHEICLEKPGQAFALEIHHSLVADQSFTFAVPVDWFWSQTELVAGDLQARYQSLRILNPAAQVLYAAAHAMLQHGGQNAPLRWFYDLDRMIRVHAERTDWELLLSQARAFEWGSALEAALSQTKAYFNTPLLASVRIELSKSSDRHRSLVAQKQVRPATHILAERQKMLSLNGYGRLRLALALLIPSPAYMRWRYQLRAWWPLPAYYLFRWAGILRDALETLKVSFVSKKREPQDFLVECSAGMPEKSLECSPTE